MLKTLDLIRIASKLVKAIARFQVEGYLEIKDKWLERNNIRIIIARRDYNIVCTREE